jgi:hypothetical protein
MTPGKRAGGVERAFAVAILTVFKIRLALCGAAI